MNDLHAFEGPTHNGRSTLQAQGPHRDRSANGHEDSRDIFPTRAHLCTGIHHSKGPLLHSKKCEPEHPIVLEARGGNDSRRNSRHRTDIHKDPKAPRSTPLPATRSIPTYSAPGGQNSLSVPLTSLEPTSHRIRLNHRANSFRKRGFPICRACRMHGSPDLAKVRR